MKQSIRRMTHVAAMALVLSAQVLLAQEADGKPGAAAQAERYAAMDEAQLRAEMDRLVQTMTQVDSRVRALRTMAMTQDAKLVELARQQAEIARQIQEVLAANYPALAELMARKADVIEAYEAAQAALEAKRADRTEEK